ncbi:MAG: hypothetical protein WCQ54_04710, partial [Clostridiaceae bacterium]
SISTILAGISGDAASTIGEVFSLGTSTGVFALTAAASTAAVATGAVGATFSRNNMKKKYASYG